MSYPSTAGAARYRIPDHRSGTTFLPIRFDFIENDEPVDLSGAYARLQARDSRGQVVIDWQTSNHPDVDPTNGYISVEDTEPGRLWVMGPGVLTTDVYGTFSFDLKVHYADGTTFVDIEGVFTVIEGVTQ